MTNIKDALELAANVLLGAETAATLERNYAKGSEYEENRKVIETTLSQLTASPDREKVAVTRDDLLAILNGYLSVEVRGPNGGWQEIVGAEDAADAILRLVATIAPDEAAIRADERPYCDPTAQGEAFYLAMYMKDGAIWDANQHKDVWINKARDYERRRAAAIRSGGTSER